MKKSTAAVAVLLCLAILLSLTACGKKRTPATVSAVREEIRERGFEVEALGQDNGAPGVPSAMLPTVQDGVMFIKTQDAANRLLGSFSVFETEDEAKRAWDSFETEAEAAVTGVKSRLANELIHYSFLRVSDKQTKVLLIRVENTVLLLDAGPAFFDEADEIAQNLGYK